MIRRARNISLTIFIHCQLFLPLKKTQRSPPICIALIEPFTKLSRSSSHASHLCAISHTYVCTYMPYYNICTVYFHVAVLITSTTSARFNGSLQTRHISCMRAPRLLLLIVSLWRTILACQASFAVYCFIDEFT